jgi:hypothetical protein
MILRKSIVAIAMFAVTLSATTANEIYSGEPYGEALFDLVNSSALLVAHELSSASGTTRTDVFRLADGRLVAVVSRAAKFGAVFGIVSLRATPNPKDKLTKDTPTVASLKIPKKQAEQDASGNRR